MATDGPLPLVGLSAESGLQLRFERLDDACTADGGVVLSEATAEALTSTHDHTIEVTVYAEETVTSVVEVASWVSAGDALVGRTAGDGGDRSVRAWAGLAGQIRRVTELEAPKGVARRIEIELGWVHRAEVGDTLRDPRGELLTVTEIRPSLPAGVQALWSGLAGPMEIQKMRCAAQVLSYRAIGPTSPVTRRPLAGSGFPPESVTVRDLRVALHAGAHTLCEEWTLAKSDAPEARRVLAEGGQGMSSAVLRELPHSARALQGELRSLGLEVDFDAACPSVRPMDTEGVRSLAPGEVRKPETVNYRTLEPEPQGLFCEEIFGAVDSPERDTRLGRVELGLPLVHPLFKQAVADALGLTVADLQLVLAYERRLVQTDHGFALGSDEPETTEDAGALAVRRALERLGQSDRWIMDAWPVMPVGLRPLVALPGGRFATSDLNDLYRRLVNRNNRLRRLMELDAPVIIVRNEARMLEEALSRLVDNRPSDRQVKGPNRRPLMSVCDLLVGRAGDFLLRKPVDHSGRAAVVADPQLPDDRCRLPDSMVQTLLDPLPQRPVVLAPHGADAEPGLFCCDVEAWDGSAVQVSPWVARCLGRTAVIHVPITPEAVREAQDLLRPAPPPPRRVPRGGWIRGFMTARDPVKALRNAALAEASDPVADDLTRLALGRGAKPA